MDKIETNLTRRRTMRLMAGATGAAAVGVGADQAGLSPVGDADALPVAALPVAAGVGFATDWLLREADILGADDPPEGLTADVLRQQVHDEARKRKSNNGSKFVDNQNIIKGITHVAYSNAKLAAIEEINAESSESDVLAAANEAIDGGETDVIKNLLQTGWNESVSELYNWKAAVESHSELSLGDVIEGEFETGTVSSLAAMETEMVTLADGTEFELKKYNLGTSNADGPYDNLDQEVIVKGANDTLRYMNLSSWNAIITSVEDAFTEVRNGISTWVTNVYSEVQSGDLDPTELMSPSELAEVTSDDEQFPQAVHDLMALNVAVDLEREAEVYFPDSGATVYGSLGVDGDTSVSTGTIDPSADDYTYYLTYDVSEGTGTWQDFNSGIDGGTATFTAEPYSEVVYSIATTAGETVEVASDQFSDQGDGTWTVDLSSDLDTGITEVDSVSFQANVEETQNETVRLQNTFEVKGFTDSEGNEHEEADFTRTETQSDDNYITESEWTDMMDKQQSLIDKYEESQQAGGGVGGGDGLLAGLAVDLGPLGRIPGAVTAGALSIAGLAGAGKAGLFDSDDGGH